MTRAIHAPSNPQPNPLTARIARDGLTKSTVRKVTTAVALVSPAPRRAPARINWEDWAGCTKATIFRMRARLGRSSPAHQLVYRLTICSPKQEEDYPQDRRR
jgi:hypothetical protein